MPNVESALKRMRKSRRQEERNRFYRSRVRTAIKKVRAAATAPEAEPLLQQAISSLDRAARRGIIHRNTAARHKSRLARIVQRLTARAS